MGTGHAKTYNPVPVPAIIAWETSWEARGPTASVKQDTGWNVDLDEGKQDLRGKRPSCNYTQRWHQNEEGAHQGQPCEQRQSRKKEPLQEGMDGGVTEACPGLGTVDRSSLAGAERSKTDKSDSQRKVTWDSEMRCWVVLIFLTNPTDSEKLSPDPAKQKTVQWLISSVCLDPGRGLRLR